jgi:pimeloyl-ACP methyl ester carboxylesterase
MAADVRALITELVSRYSVTEVDFAGYPMGGFIGMHVLTTDKRIRRAVISAVGAAAGGGKLGTSGGASVVNQAAIADAMERFAADPTMDVKNTITDADARAFLRYARFTGADLLALAAHMRALQLPPEEVGAIRAQVLVLAGRDDHLAKTAEDLAALMPTAQMVCTNGDHLTAIAQPDYRSAFTSFLCSIAP